MFADGLQALLFCYDQQGASFCVQVDRLAAVVLREKVSRIQNKIFISFAFFCFLLHPVTLVSEFFTAMNFYGHKVR